MKSVPWVCACAVVALAICCLSAPASAQFGGEGFTAEEDSPSISAERQESAAAAEPACLCIGQGDSPRAESIKQKLRSPLLSDGLQFSDTPLELVVANLRDQYGIEVQIDARALDEVGLGPDELVTVDLRNISLQSALRLMLETVHMTYLIRDEVLMITTLEEADVHLLTCVYDVRDLVGAGSSDALIDVILSCVATDTWRENGGGEAEIRSLPRGLLVISQTQAIHDEIRQLLQALSKLGHRADDHQLAGGDAFLADPDSVVTRNYQLRPVEKADRKALPRQVANLIVQMLPDERWKGKLDSGEPVLLMVLPDRVILRHRQSVQNEVRKLLVESGLIAAGQRGFGGGHGGAIATESSGGGFFRPDPENTGRPHNKNDAVAESPLEF